MLAKVFSKKGFAGSQHFSMVLPIAGFSEYDLGGCQKLLSGFFPVRGGKGVPPNSAKENSTKKQVFFAYFHTFFWPFLSYGLFGPFLTLFNTKTSFLVLLGNKIPEKLNGNRTNIER